MKFFTRSILVHSLFGAAVLASPIVPPPVDNKRRYLPPVDVARLESGVKTEKLLDHAQRLQEFAEVTPAFNRAAGTRGHNLTLSYILDSLRDTNYYNIVVQKFGFVWYEGDARFQTEGITYPTSDFIYSPPTGGGDPLFADLARVNNFGCDPVSPFFSTLLKLASLYHTDCMWAKFPERLHPRRCRKDCPDLSR